MSGNAENFRNFEFTGNSFWYHFVSDGGGRNPLQLPRSLLATCASSVFGENFGHCLLRISEWPD